MSPSEDNFNFSDADLNGVMRRALFSIGAMTLVAAPIVWAVWGWRTLVLLAVGAGVSASGIWEWQRLLIAMMAAMDAQPENAPKRPSAAPVLIKFFLRLGLAAAVLYVTLKCCNGSVYALFVGLAFSLIALGIEAARLLLKG